MMLSQGAFISPLRLPDRHCSDGESPIYAVAQVSGLAGTPDKVPLEFRNGKHSSLDECLQLFDPEEAKQKLMAENFTGLSQLIAACPPSEKEES